MSSIQNMLATTTLVTRNGHKQTIDAEELVVGDSKCRQEFNM